MSLRTEPLSRLHDRKSFMCGDPSIDGFLREKAMQDQDRRLSSTHVLVNSARPFEIVGFHTLTFTTISQQQIPNDRPRITRGIPVVLLGQIGINSEHQGIGLGDKLLTDAQFKVFEVAAHIFVRAMILDAHTERLARWYESHAFTRFPDKLRMVKHIDLIRKLFAER